MAKAMKFGSGKVKRYYQGGTATASTSIPVPEKGTGLKKETFKEAFRRARNRKAPDFEYNGETFSTEYKEEKAAREAKEKAEEDAKERRMSSIGDKYRADKTKQSQNQVPKASSAEMERRGKREKEQAIESVNPEYYLGVGAAAKALPKLVARAVTKTTPKAVSKRVEPNMASPKRTPKDADEARFADEGNPNFKRGGKVKKMASGGSASKRADGCAIRGKTRA